MIAERKKRQQIIEARLPPLGIAALRYELLTADGGRWPLRLRERAPVLDPRDGTALAWLDPEPGAAPLHGGQTGRVRVLLAEDGAARGADVPLLVPARAVRRAHGSDRPLRFRAGPSRGRAGSRFCS
mgnify:CR=1 FL=1